VLKKFTLTSVFMIAFFSMKAFPFSFANCLTPKVFSFSSPSATFFAMRSRTKETTASSIIFFVITSRPAGPVFIM